MSRAGRCDEDSRRCNYFSTVTGRTDGRGISSFKGGRALRSNLSRAQPRTTKCRDELPRPKALCRLDFASRAQCGPCARIIGEPAEVCCRHRLIRISPGSTKVDIAPIVRGYQTIVDQCRALFIHECHIAGPAGGDDRLAQQHCLGEPQSETLTAMQRQHDVRRRWSMREGPYWETCVSPVLCLTRPELRRRCAQSRLARARDYRP